MLCPTYGQLSVKLYTYFVFIIIQSEFYALRAFFKSKLRNKNEINIIQY